MNCYKHYRGKVVFSKEEFSQIFCYESEKFITKGAGCKKALKSFVEKICDHLKDTASIVCKDRTSGEHLTLVLHHSKVRCECRYKLTTLKAAVLAEENVELNICQNGMNCNW